MTLTARASTRLVLTHARMATMAGGGAPYGLVEDGAVAIEDGRIVWAGPSDALDPALAGNARTVDCRGRLLTPGLIDCHTHLVHGGDRAAEFEMRLTGVPYEEIARRGGGIVSTVKATREAAEETLFRTGLRRLDALIAEGVTTVEIKSGYGLDTASELKMLRVARRLGHARPVTVSTSFLGAHALPPEYGDARADYVALVADEMIPAVAREGLADAVDGFCEGIAFSVDEMDRVFAAARAHGLPVKLHAEQLSDLGGAALAARHGAMSADHLEYLDAAGVAAMAEAGTAAVLLPGAFYYLRETRLPPVAELREAGVPIAVATDLNPGTSPVHSLLAAMNMACVLFRLTPEEALKGVTGNAARALRLADRGAIARGMHADLCLWDVETPAALAYPLGFNPLAAVLKDGAVVRGELAP
ncbi:imidazolonepropionase [Kaustia mangrovi]|uniref:Imidazolonepropionase n=1 Tax=Kaustia mangrovi TaxID=2593653 RepID=A0A7S8HCF4_9HYPH|nr:imidazolonepropionase [Kaustia mangrovi]QPC43183.1 imidazolonepropionase [Kaustia mangrovi]